MNFTLDSSGLSGAPLTLLPGLGVLWIAAMWIITAIIHISFAVAVLRDSHSMLHRQQRGTFLVGGTIWALATLLGGVFTAAIYWMIHHSTLRPQPSPAPGSH